MGFGYISTVPQPVTLTQHHLLMPPPSQEGDGVGLIVLALLSSSKILTAQHATPYWGLERELNEKTE